MLIFSNKYFLSYMHKGSRKKVIFFSGSTTNANIHPSSLVVFYLRNFFWASKKFYFLIGPAITTPPPLSGQTTKKHTFFAASLYNYLQKRLQVSNNLHFSINQGAVIQKDETLTKSDLLKKFKNIIYKALTKPMIFVNKFTDWFFFHYAFIPLPRALSFFLFLALLMDSFFLVW